MNTETWIGCSGFLYRNWKGEFYPSDLPTSKWLPYYAEEFNTVEINASFYKLPTLRTLDTWYKKTPSPYKIAIKMNRLITHYKRFKGVDSETKEFYRIARLGLREKLGPVLFQTPPSFTYDPDRLVNLLEYLDPSFENVVEFRHASWWRPEVYEALRAQNITFCSVSYPNLPEVVIKTSSTGYMRFHGNRELFKSTYTKEEIEYWAEQLLAAKFQKLYLFFNNTWYNGAVENGRQMKKYSNGY